MSYVITKTDGTTITIAGSALNTSDTSLGLIGRAYRNYGSALNRNFVHLLENFANTTAPSNPISGQLWYKTDTGQMFVFNASSWDEINIGEGDTVVYSKMINGQWVYGFDHQNQKVGIFSTLPGTISEIGDLSVSGFNQGINAGLNIANYPNSGVYGTSALHLGIGNLPPRMTINASSNSLFGNIVFRSDSDTITLNLLNSFSGVSVIKFTNEFSDLGSISFNNLSETLTIDAYGIELFASSISFGLEGLDTSFIVNSYQANFKNVLLSGNMNIFESLTVGGPSVLLDVSATRIIVDDFIKVESLIVNTNITSDSININQDLFVDGGVIVGSGSSFYKLDIKSDTDTLIRLSNPSNNKSSFIIENNSSKIWSFGTEPTSANFILFNEKSFKPSIIVDSDTNFIGINKAIPETELDISGVLSTEDLKIKNNLSEYYMPISADVTGKFLMSQGNGNRLSWESVLIQEGKYGYTNEIISDILIDTLDFNDGIIFSPDWDTYSSYDITFKNLYVSAPAFSNVYFRVLVDGVVQTSTSAYNYTRKTIVSTSAFKDNENIPITFVDGISNSLMFSRDITVKIEKNSSYAAPVIFSTKNYGVNNSGQVEQVEIHGLFKSDGFVSANVITDIEFYSDLSSPVGTNATMNIVGYKR